MMTNLKHGSIFGIILVSSLLRNSIAFTTHVRLASQRSLSLRHLDKKSFSGIKFRFQLLAARNQDEAAQSTICISVRCEEESLLELDEEDDDPWEHLEEIEIPIPPTYAAMIDVIMDRYDYGGVRLKDTNSFWKVTSESGRFTALVGHVDGKKFPTDVFETHNPDSPYPSHIDFDLSSLLDDDLCIDFEPRCPKEVRHGCSGVVGGTIFFIRAMEGSEIAKAFLKAQAKALREANPESPLADQIEAILDVKQLQTA